MESGVSIDNLKVEVSNRQVLSIALPITLAILVPQLNLLINSIFLGQLSRAALGNAGITGVFYLIFAVAGHGLNNSLQSVFSKYAGADKTSFFRVVLAQGIRISLQFAIIFILFTWFLAPYILQKVSDPASYLVEINFLKIRIWGLPFLFLFQMANAFLVATLNSRWLIVGFIFEALVNIVFDYLLIFGKGGLPAMGFNGAAVASILAECTGLVAVISVIYLTGLKRKYKLFTTFSYHKKLSKEIFSIALPLVFQFIISVTTWLVFFLLVESKGNMAKAISNTMRNVFGLAGVFVWAFSGTSNTMVANLIGQQKEHLVIPVIKKISYWSMGLCLFLVLLLNIFPALFFSLFGNDPSFIKEGTSVIRTVSLGILFMSFSNVWLNGLTGTGKTRINLLIEIFAIIFYLIYTYYFMIYHYTSLAMAWSNECVYWLSIFIMTFVYLKSGKWKSKI